MGKPAKTILVAAMILATVFSVWSGNAVCHGFDIGRSSLAGLEGVLIGIKELPAAVDAKVLTKKQIVDDVTAQLAKADIKVHTPLESLVSPGAPTLLVSIALSEIKSPSKKEASQYLYSAQVGLSQAVTLVRNTNIGLHVETWSAEDVGQISALDEVRTKVKNLVQRFVIAYQAANTEDPGRGALPPPVQIPEPQDVPEKSSKALP